MRGDVVDRILYLTHDQWSDKTRVKSREDFRQYLLDFLHREPDCRYELESIIDLGQKENNLVLMRSVINILSIQYPETHNSLRRERAYKRLRDMLKI